MAMTGYPVLCYRPGCTRPAVYKIAARWSDGITQELQTYAQSCPDCLAGHFVASRRKQAACRLAAGEQLGQVGIYELARGNRDQQLVRRADIERQLSPPPLPPP